MLDQNFSNTNNITPLSGSSNNLQSNLINKHDQIHHGNEIGLNCYLLNARSICNKLNEFQALVFGEHLDIVAVMETWFKPDICDSEILPGNQYTIYRRDRVDGRRGGGVLLAVKSNILSFRRCEIEPLGTEIFVCELLPSKSRKLTICVCYRPPDFSNFNTAFDSLLVNLYKDGSDRSRMYFLGDFNYPNINWQTNTTIEEWEWKLIFGN